MWRSLAIPKRLPKDVRAARYAAQERSLQLLAQRRVITVWFNAWQFTGASGLLQYRHGLLVMSFSRRPLAYVLASPGCRELCHFQRGCRQHSDCQEPAKPAVIAYVSG